LGSVNIVRLAPPVHRSLFQGLAQVIVQAPRSAATIRLTAAAEGLAAAETIVDAKPATLRAAVP
jgi:hypothetical protein